MLLIHLRVNEWHEDPYLFWRVFRLLLEEGARQKIGGDDNVGFGRLFILMPRLNTNLIDKVFKCPEVTYEKIPNIIQDGNVRIVVEHQLAMGNLLVKYLKTYQIFSSLFFSKRSSIKSLTSFYI